MKTRTFSLAGLLLLLVVWPACLAAPVPTPETPKLRAILEGHKHYVTFLAISPDGTILASACRDGTVKLWSVQKGTEIATLAEHKDGVGALAFSPDSKTLATSDRNCIKLWNLTGAQPTVTETFKTFSGRLLFSPDGKTLISDGDSIKLWDLATKQARVAFKFGERESAIKITYTTEGKLLLATGKLGSDYGTYLYDVGEGKKLVTLKDDQAGGDGSAFSPDGKTIAGYGYNTICIWEIDTGKPKVTLKVDDTITYLAFNPKGTILAVGRRPREGKSVGTISLLDAATGKELAVLKEHAAAISCLVFSPDSKTLASCGIGDDKTVKLWSIPEVIKAKK